MPWIACGGFYPRILPAQDSRNLGNHGKLGRQGKPWQGMGGRQTLNFSTVCLTYENTQWRKGKDDLETIWAIMGNWVGKAMHIRRIGPDLGGPQTLHLSTVHWRDFLGQSAFC